MKKHKVATLELDFELHPRCNIDAVNVSCLIEALKAGAELPPIIIDKKSKRVVDGFHRVKAYLRHFGPDAEAACVEKSYANEADLFADMVRYNAAHGARMDTVDRTRCVLLAEKVGLSVEKLAGCLSMTVDRLAVLKVSRTANTNTGLSIPLKRTFRAFAGRTLTKDQQEVNDRSSGMSQLFYVNQLIDMLEHDMFEATDEFMTRLKKLGELIASKSLVGA